MDSRLASATASIESDIGKLVRKSKFITGVEFTNYGLFGGVQSRKKGKEGRRHHK